MGHLSQQIIETETNQVQEHQHSFTGADATCFGLSLGHLQAYMKQTVIHF
jgi:hypothetical protein